MYALDSKQIAIARDQAYCARAGEVPGVSPSDPVVARLIEGQFGSTAIELSPAESETIVRLVNSHPEVRS
jgi:hypothetical protein